MLRRAKPWLLPVVTLRHQSIGTMQRQFFSHRDFAGFMISCFRLFERPAGASSVCHVDDDPELAAAIAGEPHISTASFYPMHVCSKSTERWRLLTKSSASMADSSPAQQLTLSSSTIAQTPSDAPVHSLSTASFAAPPSDAAMGGGAAAVGGDLPKELQGVTGSAGLTSLYFFTTKLYIFM